MGKKFDAIFEALISRHQAGGYLPGDIVVFRKNYKSCECYKLLPTAIQDDLDEMVDSGLNIRVIQVGDNLSGPSGNNQYKTSKNAVITVAADHGGGRHYSSITISPEMIDLANPETPNLAKVPDKFKRVDKTNIKPEPFKRDDKFITNVTDKGDGKYTPTNLKLAGESTMIRNDVAKMGALYESIYKKNPEANLDERTKEQINDKIRKSGLDGNGRFRSAGQGLNIVASILDDFGYSLDMVSNDMEITKAHHHPGMKGNRMIALFKKPAGDDPFMPGTEIENSRLSFSFENLSRRGDEPKPMEILAYIS
jgi:hypothetical protein